MTEDAEDDATRRRDGGEEGVAGPEDAANVEAMGAWDRVVRDMAATAEEYAEQGWETFQLHPGDVHPEPGDEGDLEPGFDVVLPDAEYERLADLVEDGYDVDEIDVYRADVESLTYVLFSLLDADAGLVVFAPTYYRPTDDDVETLFRRAGKRGSLQLYLRRLAGDYVEVAVEDPSLVAPPED